MNVDIYQSVSNPTKFLSVLSGTKVEELSLEGEDATHFAEVKPFKKALTLDASDKRIALDAEQVIQKIKSTGYAMHGVQFRFQEGA